ncbi:MAG: hypothetical protein ACFFBE_14705, partial [Promethearchaeota archaeon]
YNRTDKLAFMAGEMASSDIRDYPSKIQKAVDSGVGYYLVSFQRTEDIKQFADEVIPSFK